MKPRRFFFVVAVCLTMCAAMTGRADVPASYAWKLPKNFPAPRVPADAISPAARRGEVLYFSQPLSCFRCHGGFTFSGAVDFEGRRETEVEFHNTGLYNLAGALSYPSPNTGIYEITRRPEDVGKFKAPTLRNIAVTAPYMHDGSVATLEDALAHYAAGGRTIADGPNRGNGHDNPGKVQQFAAFRSRSSSATI